MAIEVNIDKAAEQPIEELIFNLKDIGINLWVEGAALKYEGPKGAVTVEILQRLKERKPELIKYLKEKDGKALYFEPIEAVEKAEYYPVSVAQRRMFLLNQIDRSSTAYNIINVFKIEGSLDREKFLDVMRKLAQRHDSLRTSFEMLDGSPVQRIHESVEIASYYEEISSDNDDIDQIIDSFVQAYDLSKAPLFRTKLVRDKSSESECYYLFLDMHHIISDGMSGAVLVKDFNELYSGRELPELKIQYREFVNWHEKLISSNVMKGQREYWLGKLSGELPILSLPTDYPRPASFSFKGDSILFSIDNELKDKLYSLTRAYKVTLNVVLLSALNILLARYSGQSDIVIGTPTAGRRNADLFDMIGMLVNTVANRNYTDSNKSFIDFLREVGENSLDALDNQDYPFEQLVEDLRVQRDLSRNPVFDVMFVLQNISVDSIKIGNMKVSRYDFRRKSAYVDLTLFGEEIPNGISFELNYCSALYSRETAERLSRHYVNILKYISEKPDSRLQEIELASEEEIAQILKEFNNTAFDYPRNKTINELFELQAEKTPENIAVVWENTITTYAQLNSRANCIANTLRKKGVERGCIVAVMAERSPSMIAAVLGIMKAGAVFLPIDPAYPRDRIEYILEDGSVKILITQRAFADKTDTDIEMLYLEDEAIYKNTYCNQKAVNTSEDVLYTIYTSGTTGKPKGVLLKHKNMVNLVYHQYNTTDIDFSGRVLQFTTLCFDVCYQEMFSTLLRGGQLHIIDETSKKDVSKLFGFIEKNGLETVFLPTSFFKFIINEEEYINVFPSCIKHLITAGEQLIITGLFKEYIRNNDLVLHNHYGPSETHVVTTFSINGGEIADIPPIGKPICNTHIYIFDRNMNLQPIGIPGELYISGDNVGAGYLGKPALTDEKFLRDPFYPENRMYKTGDLARWLSNGNIEFLGRADHQVKIRGFRIELGEIEAVLLKHENIRETLVIVKDDNLGGKYLCAYIAAELDMKPSDVKEYLSANLPEYMIPSCFVFLRKMPLTSNGKLDRRALPEPEAGIQIDSEYEAPQSDTEIRLAAIWTEVLGVAPIGAMDNFFELGGHSLKATALVSKVHKQLGVELALSEVFSAKTLRKLAKRIDSMQKTIYSSIRPVMKQEYYPQSPAQRRLFVLKQLDGDSTTYNMPLVLEAEGLLDRERFENAFKALVQRHEALRTTFVLVAGEPVQRVYDNAELEFIYKKSAGENINSLIKSIIKPFDFKKAPLLRVGLIELDSAAERNAQGKYIIVCDMHHIVSDGVSVSIIAKEFTALYMGACLPELKLQYKDYSEWQHSLLESGEIKRQEEYWLDVMGGELPVLNLPLDYTRPDMQSFEGSVLTFETSQEAAKGLNALAAETGSTLYMVLLAAYNVLLAKYSGQEDIIVGSPIAGRNHADLENIIGIFLNTLAMRNYPSAEKTFIEFLQEVKENCLGAYENQDYQFEDLVEKIQIKRDIRRNPLFDVMFVLQNEDSGEMNVPELSLKPYEFENKISKFDMTLNAVEEGDRIAFDLEYCTKLFKKETIERLVKHYINILKEISEKPYQKISEIEMLTGEEKEKILYKFNDTKVKYPKDKTIYELFEEQVEKTPDNIAVVYEERQLTYRELNERANQLARVLRDRGVGPDSIVGIMVDRSIEMIVGILGILKSGGAYLPIDTEYPQERIKFMFEDSGANILITHGDLASKIDFDGYVIDLNDRSIYARNISNPGKISTSENLAYIIYTSGSTGKPKGNLTTHYNVSRVVMNTNYINIRPDDVILQLSNYAFDGSVFDIFGALLNGAKLTMVDKDTILDIYKLSKFIEEKGVTVFFVTTALFNTIVDVNIDCLKIVRKVLFGGERVSVKHARKALQYIGRDRIIHVYGPTESTVYATYYFIDEIDEDAENIPIGRPLSNTQAYIVDKNNTLLPVGAAGELCISGDGLARGYLNRTELTAEKFVPNPFIPDERMYRTGDLARWLPDGNIEFLGRIDHQVKIRGFRIELGEIETQLLKHKNIKETVVIAREGVNGDKYLCAYIVSDREITVAELKGYLSKELPDYMVPSYFMQLDKLPLTPNGKIDRRAFPEPDGSISTGVEYIEPLTDTEIRLAKIWREILGVERIGVNDGFFELGGHSLKATILVSRIHKEFDVEAPLKEVFMRQTIKELAEYIKEAYKNIYSGIEAVEEKKYYSVSSAQKRMYILNQMERSSSIYNIPGVVVIEGKLDREKLEESFRQLVGRHEAFRTYFDTVEGEPVQKVLREAGFKIEYKECNECESEVAVKEFIRPFDLGKAPLIRVGLIKIGERRHILVVDMHHIISDGTSMGIIIKEFTSLYNGESLPELRIQYKDFSEWQNKLFRSEKINKQEEYWLKVFEGEIPVLDMPTDYPRPSIQNFEGDRINFEIGEELTARLKNLSSKIGATLYMTLLGGYNILLSKYSGEEDIVVGTPIAGRPHADLHGIIGMFVNTIAMRNYPEGSKTVEEFLKEVKENSLRAYENQDYQFEELVEKLEIKRDLSRNPLFDVMFVLQNEDLGDLEIEGLKLKPYEYENTTAKFDITLNAAEVGDKVVFSLEYCTKLYKKETIERLGRHYIKLLDGICEKPYGKIVDLEILSEEERRTLLHDFNNTAAEYPKDKTIHELFEEQVEKTPDNIAVVYEDNQLTYRKLNQKANQLARVLREKGVGPDSIVGIMVERSLEMIVGILGILKAGGAYLPIDPTYPPDRVKYILEDSGTRVLLIQSFFKDVIEYDGNAICLDDKAEYNGNISNIQNINSPGDLAYVIYTSGTTGRPKGVMIEHRNVVRLLYNDKNQFDFSSKDVWTMFHSFCFDFSVWEMYGALLYGGKLVIVPKLAAQNPGEYLRLLKQQKVTVLNQTPTAFYKLSYEEMKYEGKGLAIRYVIFGGEALKPLMLRDWRNKYPQTKIINMYGITETTVHVTYKEILEQDIEINLSNIGKPIPTLTTYIMDRNSRILPVGVPGELCVGGEGVARGYLNRPELTLEKFIDNPYKSGERIYRSGDLAKFLADGNMEYLGRIDHQVKIRGFRIETDEIEAQLLKHGYIKEAVVIAREDESGEKYLCAYIVADREITVAELREYLSKELPDYMIPSFFVKLDKLPMTPNGKVDRKVLPEPDGSINTGVEYEAPSNMIEERLVKLWQEVLKIDLVGVNHNFFELGGHSLKATVLISRVHKEFNVEMPLKEVFNRQTVKEQAKYIKETEESIYKSIQPIEEREYYPASSAQKRLYVLSGMEAGDTAYNMPGVIIMKGNLDREKLAEVFRQIVEKHESLRTSFDMLEGKVIQRVHKDAVLELGYMEVENGEENEDIRIQEYMKDFVSPFDLGKAPLVRTRLVKLEEGRHLLMFDMHHIISDGVSIGILLKEIASLYGGRNLPKLKVQYRDFSVWQEEKLKTEVIKKQEEYWLNVFSEEIPVLNMPTDYQRPAVQSFEGNTISFEAKGELVKGLKKTATDMGATMYMVLLGAYNVLLSKYADQEDVVVGTPIAGRPHADLQGIIGMFVNTLAMRNYPEGNKTVKEFLQEVKENSLRAYENQDYQFEDLVEKIQIKRDIRRNPLFDVMFVLQNEDSGEMNVPGLSLKPYEFENKISKFDMTLNAVEEGDRIAFNLEYCTKLFKKETIERFVKHYINILREISEKPYQKISEIEMLTAEEKEKILYKFNDTKVKYPKDKTIYELFEEQVEKTPDNVAVVYEEKQLTYRELNERAYQLARVLRDRGVRPDSIAGIMVERSIEMIVGILGILKSGGAYLPIDPLYPKERIEYMLSDSGTGILLTNKRLFDGSKAEFNGLIMDLYDRNLYAGEETNLENINSSNDLAYVIYTSGTTGKPKGVMIEHQSIANTIQWRREEYKLDSTDNVLQLFSYSFDGFLTSFFTPIISGSRTILLSDLDAKDPVRIKNCIEFKRITHFICVPALYSPIMEVITDKEASSLRIVTLAGDKLTSNLIAKTKQISTKLELVNEYGPTESSVASTIFRNIQPDKEVTIGNPIANTKIYIVNKNNRIQPIGLAGELCIAGEGLARGYLNRPELTLEKFTPNPFVPGTKMYRTGDLARWLPDGNIEFLGRIDHQVKIRGFRIELGEIETQLLKHENIKEAVVVARERGNREKYLCAYIVADREITVMELKEYLSKGLPDYMLPSFFVQLDKLPLTPNGKVDRKVLPEPDGSINTGVEYEAPSNEIEEKLAVVWQSILGVSPVGVNNNFFDLGGDSIKAIQVRSALKDKFGLEMEVKDLFVNNTIRKLSANVKAKSTVINQEAVLGKVDMTPIQRWFFGQARKDMHHFNQAVMLYNRNGFEEDIITKVFGKLTEHHDALRMVYKAFDGDVEQINMGVEVRAFDLRIINLLGDDGYEERMQEEANKLQVSIDLNNGPLIKLGLFKTGEGDHLLIIVHHLVIDGVSWRILLEDFAEGYMQALSGKDIRFKLKTNSYKEWADKLIYYSNSTMLLQEIHYWSEIENSRIALLPKDNDVEKNKYSDSRYVSIQLSNVETDKLLKNIHWAYKTQINDILLTALGLAFKEWTGQNKVLISMEGHGREEIIKDIDLTRTVGWFTSIFPIIINVADTKEISENIIGIKEGLRNIPNNGIGYGILKYLTDKKNIGLMEFKIKPEISFNYLGQFDSEVKTEHFEISRFSAGSSWSPESERISNLDINAVITKGKFTLTISYSMHQYKGDTILKLAESYKKHLLNIIDYCLKRENSEITPSDLTYDKLSIQELNDIQDEISDLIDDWD